jgi:hypothetical protein
MDVDAARLSLPVHQRDRRRMLLIGMLFVAISGLMYFAFMAAWLGLFLVVGGLPWVTAAAGRRPRHRRDQREGFRGLPQGLSCPSRGRQGRHLPAGAGHPEGRPPAGHAGGDGVSGVAANFYELLCTAGFPMVYTRLLSLQVPDRAAQYGWLALYNLVYVLPLRRSCWCSSARWARAARRAGGRLLKLLSGLMMLGLGLCLVLAPQAWATRGWRSGCWGWRRGSPGWRRGGAVEGGSARVRRGLWHGAEASAPAVGAAQPRKSHSGR